MWLKIKKNSDSSGGRINRTQLPVPVIFGGFL